MGKATNLLHRQMLIQLKGEGKNLSEISELLNVPYSTLRNLWHRYRHLGVEKLAAEYANCGRLAPDRSNLVYRASLWLKYLHPQWGSPLIHYHLSQRYGLEAMVSIRTLQRWYKAANLVKPREQKSVEKIGKAQGVHNIWQVDAKERLVLADGQVACYLTIVDEKSGACLEAPVFPLCPNQPSSA